MRSFIILAFFAFFTSFQAFAESVAKVIVLKGEVIGHYQGKTTSLKKDDAIPEGMSIETKAKSFAKLLFTDKSQMTVGPESRMDVTQFPKDKPGILTLVKGQLRSQVTKNYMDQKDKDKSKLFVKTETAAMGVRGTDFQVSFNEVNKATALVTFEGRVAMVQLHDALPQMNQVSLEKMVSSSVAVTVEKGQFSGANPDLNRATIPTKIALAQLNTLEQNTTFVSDGSQRSPSSEAPSDAVRSVQPPGVAGQEFASTPEVLNKLSESASPSMNPPAEGFYDPKTGALAPKAGGLVDLKTAAYIPPPKDAAFDSATGTFEMPASVGKVDPATGSFTNDNYTLSESGEFVPKEATTGTAAKESNTPPPPVSMTDPAAMAQLPPPPTDFQMAPANSPATKGDKERAPASTPGSSPGAKAPSANGTAPSASSKQDVFVAPPAKMMGGDMNTIKQDFAMKGPGAAVSGNASANGAPGAARTPATINPNDFNTGRLLQDKFNQINTNQTNQVIQQEQQQKIINQNSRVNFQFK
jgi:hypothetical protein